MSRTYKIIISIIAILLLLVFIFFEIKQVADIEWVRNFDVEEKHAGDAYLFSKLLENRYGTENMEFTKEDKFLYLEEYNNTTLVMLDAKIDLDSVRSEQLWNFMSRGNEVLLISEYLDIDEEVYNPETGSREFLSDTISNLTWYDSTSYTLDHYWEGLEEKYSYSSSYFDDEYSNGYLGGKDLLYLDDTLCIFRSYSIDSGFLFIHTQPDLFMNVLGLQESYRQNFNKTFSCLNNENIILHNFSTRNVNAGRNEDSLFKYILNQRSLKYAYYLMLLFSIIYLVFASKRKQKFIPVVEPLKNTSLEYIYTTSELFKAQDQNRKLIPHMGKIYHNNIKKKYFLNIEDPNFTKLLAVKSKVSISLIESIENQIKSARDYDFNDDQLLKLYNDINSFYKHCK